MMNSMVSATQTNLTPQGLGNTAGNAEDISQYISSVQYSYDLDMNLYAEDVDGLYR